MAFIHGVVCQGCLFVTKITLYHFPKEHLKFPSILQIGHLPNPNFIFLIWGGSFVSPAVKVGCFGDFSCRVIPVAGPWWRGSCAPQKYILLFSFLNRVYIKKKILLDLSNFSGTLILQYSADIFSGPVWILLMTESGLQRDYLSRQLKGSSSPTVHNLLVEQ